MISKRCSFLWIGSKFGHHSFRSIFIVLRAKKVCAPIFFPFRSYHVQKSIKLFNKIVCHTVIFFLYLFRLLSIFYLLFFRFFSNARTKTQVTLPNLPLAQFKSLLYRGIPETELRQTHRLANPKKKIKFFVVRRQSHS